jgi:hypothetical protein
MNYDVLAEGVVVSCIIKAAALPEAMPSLWTLATNTRTVPRPHGYEATREATMAASPRAGGGE